jgi:SNF2 family DNA or RNA helicase
VAVVVQHIVTAGTIDERILEAISHKEKGQNALIEAVKAEL